MDEAAAFSPALRNSAGAAPSHRAMKQAAEWFALLRSGEAGERDHVRWQSWLDENPDHRLAWRYVEEVSRNFAPIHAMPDPRRTGDDLWRACTRTLQRRRMLAGIAALAGSGLLGWTSWRHTPLSGAVLARMADHRTATGEIRPVVLPDGVRVWLNTASAFDADYRSDLRRLHLIAGEILVQTVANLSRPFVVDTSEGRLRALGTRFVVRQETQETFLAVYQGAVEVLTGTGKRFVVPAGKETRFSADAQGGLGQADSAHEAWNRHMLVVRDMPLGEVVRTLRRYRNGYLGIAPEVAGLRVFGSFPLENTDDTLEMLASALPVRIRRRASWWVSIEPEEKTKAAGR